MGFIVLLLTGCSDPPVVHGTVQNIWGTAIEGAEVRMEGINDPQLTIADGSFSFPAKDGVLRFRADAGGHIYDVETISFDLTSEAAQTVMVFSGVFEI